MYTMLDREPQTSVPINAARKVWLSDIVVSNEGFVRTFGEFQETNRRGSATSSKNVWHS